jgi:hypothetical protein
VLLYLYRRTERRNTEARRRRERMLSTSTTNSKLDGDRDSRLDLSRSHLEAVFL